MAQLLSTSFKITKGMLLDLDNETASNETAYLLKNIKALISSITTLNTDSGVTNALLNERGTKPAVVYPLIEGSILGIIECTNLSSVLFTRSGNTNYIYKLTYSSETSIKSTVLAEGEFNFGSYIAGIFCFENSEIQKVYWVDGVNLLRYININRSDKVTSANDLNSTPAFKFNHTITVERINGGGTFSPGVILYAFTYFNRYGAETNIVDMTPLYYLSEIDRGTPADEKVGCSYKVTITNPDSDNFDYLRLYSILRNSLEGVPVVKIVRDIKLR